MEFCMPKIVGIVNVTRDSFSDGGLYLQSEKALGHARHLKGEGADIIELGPASTHPDAEQVSPEEELRRLEPLLEALSGQDIPLSIDSYQTQTLRFCAGKEVGYLNDIQGFPDEALYPDLTDYKGSLITMFAIQGLGKAKRLQTEPHQILERMFRFFEERLQAFEKAGISLEKVILDPGMGFFLGSNPETSILALQQIPRLKEHFGRPVLISVSRKSFLGTITGRPTEQRGASTLAAECFAAQQGADYIRTHDPGALKDALKVYQALYTEISETR